MATQITRERQIEALNEVAALMGVTDINDLARWIDCLRIWTDKGYSLDEAMDRHYKVLLTLGTNFSHGIYDEWSRHRGAALALRKHMASEMWDAVNAGRA